MPDRDEAKAALERLRAWAGQATPEEVADLDPAISRLLPGRDRVNYPDLSRTYPESFEVDTAYRKATARPAERPASP